MATYRADNLLGLPRLTTPRSRVQFGSLERHTYTPPDYSDAIHQPRSRSPTYNRKELLEVGYKCNVIFLMCGVMSRCHVRCIYIVISLVLIIAAAG